MLNLSDVYFEREEHNFQLNKDALRWRVISKELL
jgi:adenylate cyclase class IV